MAHQQHEAVEVEHPVLAPVLVEVEVHVARDGSGVGVAGCFLGRRRGGALCERRAGRTDGKEGSQGCEGGNGLHSLS